MKILLDIDGVMVITPTWRQPEFLADGFMAFDTNCAKNLAELLTITQAEIVLTTTHRIHHDVETWRQIFANRGILVKNISKVNAVTSYLDFQSRDQEILAWIKNNPNEEFIIIDDDKSLRNLPDEVKKFWVETEFLTGFNDERKKYALQLL